MADSNNFSELQNAWQEFIKSVKLLLVSTKNDRLLDQFIEFRDKVLELVQSKTFIDQLVFGTDSLNDDMMHKHREALILELKSFTRAVDIGTALDKEKVLKRGWRSRWLGKASTVTGSVKDFANDNSYVKGGLILFKEACDIFK